MTGLLELNHFYNMDCMDGMREARRRDHRRDKEIVLKDARREYSHKPDLSERLVLNYVILYPLHGSHRLPFF